MSKIVQMILTGLFFTFIADFFLFLGVKLHYIDPLGIDLFYNILFADNQNFFLFIILTLAIGALVYFSDKKIYLPILIVFFLAVLSTLYPPIGKEVGEALFMQKNLTLHNDKFVFNGDILYVGRKVIYFYDKELNKTIELKKSEIKEDLDELR